MVVVADQPQGLARAPSPVRVHLLTVRVPLPIALHPIIVPAPLSLANQYPQCAQYPPMHVITKVIKNDENSIISRYPFR